MQDLYHIRDNDLSILRSKYQLIHHNFKLVKILVINAYFLFYHMNKVYIVLNYQNVSIRILMVNNHLIIL